MRSPFVLALALAALVPLIVPATRAADFAFPLRSNSVRFSAIGDMGTGDHFQTEVAQQMVKSRAALPFDFVIMLGDNVYTGSGPAAMDKDFALPYRPLLDLGVLFYAVLGNHDASNERFYKPFNMNGASYYTFKKGNVRFFALDSNYMDPKQTAWLETELRNAGKSDWKIAYFHHPLYSSGVFHGPDVDLRKVLEPLFVTYGVDVVFAGHEHVYERVLPQHDIAYFTEGSSGELRAGGLKKASAITGKGFDADRAFMMIEISGDDLYFDATSRLGTVVDSGLIHRAIRPTGASAAVRP
jgi:3',5'-cyclic AMP phosphodiesterase CpdA